jgi:hypothetical protein
VDDMLHIGVTIHDAVNCVAEQIDVLHHGKQNAGSSREVSREDGSL